MPSPLESIMSMAVDAPQSTEDTKEESMENCIKAPDSLKTPAGQPEGGAFQGTFRGFLKDGKLYFRSINNIPLPGNEDEETPEEEAEESPEEEAKETEMDMEDKSYAKKQSEDDAFKKAFHS